MKSNHYTHSLYYKLLIGYLIFGLLGFITIATISSEMTYHHLVERESEVLYDEATMIACLLYTSPSPRDVEETRMPSSA